MVKNLALILSICIFSISLLGQRLPGSNYLPIVEKQRDQIIISLKPLKANGVFLLFYRTEGMKNYQMRKMQADPSGMVRHLISIPAGIIRMGFVG